MKIEIGNDPQRNVPLTLDVTRLLDTRMLIQASSGGGKSWLLRLLAEGMAASIPTFVIDPEGEFSTLREKLDMVIVGKHGELDANPRSAALLARRLVELRVSAVLDLIELKLPERRKFVRLFIESLMDLPQALWRPLLVMIDEAHMFCPERSAGESESTEAVIDLCSRGRKRGFAAVLATQRLSKLHKDAAAELNNVVIGRTTLDLDQKRALDVLGLPASARQQLRDMEALHFFGFGPAMSCTSVTSFKAAQVKTTHPRPGERHKLKPPQPSRAIRQVVGELADLPQQAEQEIRDLADAKKKIAELERQLAAKPVAQSAQPVVIDKFVLTAQNLRELKSAASLMEKLLGQVDEKTTRVRFALDGIAQAVAKAQSSPNHAANKPATTPTVGMFSSQAKKQIVKQVAPARAKQSATPVGDEQASLGKCERAVLRVLAQHREGCLIGKLALLSGYCVSGGFRNALAALRTAGYMVGDNTNVMQITDAGLAVVDFEPLPSGSELLERWLRSPLFGKCEKAVLSVLRDCSDPRTGLPIDELAGLSGYEVSGGFRNALAALRTAGVIVGKNTEHIRLDENLL